ncbi:MAG TPA: trypsin-like serine protease [Vicinamibacterales bacterium]
MKQHSRVSSACLAASLVLAASASLFSRQQASESGPGSAESQRVGRAAIAFAREAATPDTPEFTEALRNAIAMAGRLPIDPAATRARSDLIFTRGLLDFDLRYRQNFAAMNPQQRIFGGERVPAGLYPDTVAITGNNRICTGTVIANNAVLTAAHCFCQKVSETVHFGDVINTTTVGVASGFAMIDCSAPLGQGDVAVLMLSKPVTVTPRRFAADALFANASTGRAVGFGRTENPIAEPVGIKRRVDVPIASLACTGTVNTTNGPVADATYYGCSAGQEIVAGAQSLDKDSCNGDSGGPFFLTGADGNLYLGGATSRATGPPGLRPCGDGGIYVRTDGRVRKWLQSRNITVNVGPS